MAEDNECSDSSERQNGPATAPAAEPSYSDIIAAACAVLNEPDPHRKAKLTDSIVTDWQAGRIPVPTAGTGPRPPDRPARSDKVRLVDAWDVPKRGKGGTLASRQSMLHSLVHIENVAVDLAWDAIARFGSDLSYALPRQFFDDFVTVAADECRHFQLLEKRLEETGSHYGAMPAHDGLWQSAVETAGSLPARLAVEHCCHEARGLDVLPQTVHRFRHNGDTASADLLEHVIYAEEISHCAAGVRWLRHLHQLAHSQHAWPCSSCSMPPPQQQQGSTQLGAAAEQAGGDTGSSSAAHAGRKGAAESTGGMPAWAAEARQHATVEGWFHTLIRRHFNGLLKPPFNDEARAKAGFGPEWYLPLAQEKPVPVAAADGDTEFENNPSHRVHVCHRFKI